MTADEPRDDPTPSSEPRTTNQTTLADALGADSDAGGVDKRSVRPVDDTRRAAERARELARTTSLSETQCAVVAYSELGYSSSGIAQQIDRSEPWVRGLAEDIVETYGVQAMWPNPAAEHRELTPVDRPTDETPHGDE